MSRNPARRSGAASDSGMFASRPFTVRVLYSTEEGEQRKNQLLDIAGPGNQGQDHLLEGVDFCVVDHSNIKLWLYPSHIKRIEGSLFMQHSANLCAVVFCDDGALKWVLKKCITKWTQPPIRLTALGFEPSLGRARMPTDHPLTRLMSSPAPTDTDKDTLLSTLVGDPQQHAVAAKNGGTAKRKGKCAIL